MCYFTALSGVNQAILRYGTDPNKRQDEPNIKHQTSFHHAYDLGNVEIVQLLLVDHGGNVNMCESQRQRVFIPMIFAG